MITYLDTSTLLKLVIDEQGSVQAELMWQTADTLASVSLIVLEARAALAAAARDNRLTHTQHRDAKSAVHSLIGDLHLVEVTEDLVEEAAVLAEKEALRGYDAVHLAAALSVGASVLTGADDDLCLAAGRRGMHIANPLVV